MHGKDVENWTEREGSPDAKQMFDRLYSQGWSDWKSGSYYPQTKSISKNAWRHFIATRRGISPPAADLNRKGRVKKAADGCLEET